MTDTTKHAAGCALEPPSTEDRVTVVPRLVEGREQIVDSDFPAP